MDRPEQPPDQDCSICFEPVRTNGHPFGLLEHCAHVFCFPCITTWHYQNAPRQCPVCRQSSPLVMPWPALPSQDERSSLFTMHRTTLYLHMIYNNAEEQQQDGPRGGPQGQPNESRPPPTAPENPAQSQNGGGGGGGREIRALLVELNNEIAIQQRLIHELLQLQEQDLQEFQHEIRRVVTQQQRPPRRGNHNHHHHHRHQAGRPRGRCPACMRMAAAAAAASTAQGADRGRGGHQAAAAANGAGGVDYRNLRYL